MKGSRMKRPILNKIFRDLVLQIAFFMLLLAAVNQLQTSGLVSGVARQFLLAGTNVTEQLVPQRSVEKKISIVYFMAPWCGVCRISVPYLNSLRKDMPDVNIQIIALDYDSTDDVTAFVKRYKIDLPVFFGTEAVRDFWGVSAYPSYFVIDEAMVIRSKAVGYSTKFGMIFRVLWTKVLDRIFWWD